MVDKFIDPGFKVIKLLLRNFFLKKEFFFKSFRVVSQVFAELTRVLSDSIIIPFNASAYVYEMHVLLRDYREEYGEALEEQKISLKGLEDAIANFEKTVRDFEERVKKIDKTK